MPLLLNNNPNPQAVMLGEQHLRKIMLGEEVVWQRHRSTRVPSIGDIALQTLEHHGVKLQAVNQDGNLFFPMFFPPRTIDDEQWFLGRLTFLGDTELSLQTIDAMLQADVVGKDMHFPMFFFDHKPPQDFDFRNRLTFIANIPAELALESMDGLLVAEIEGQRHMRFPMVFPESRLVNRSEFLGRLTFVRKEGFDFPDDVDFIRDFRVNVFDPARDYLQDFVVEGTFDFFKYFSINVYNPNTDFIQDFEVESVPDYVQDFWVNAFNPATDFIRGFSVNAHHSDTDFIQNFSVNAFNSATDFIQGFSVNAHDPQRDFICDHSINAFNPTRDFIRDYSISAIRARDYTQTFTVPAIRAVDYTRNFNVPAIRVGNYEQMFAVPAIRTVSFTRDFAIHSWSPVEEFKFTIDTRQTDTGLNAPVASNRHFGFYVETRRIAGAGITSVPYDWWINWGDGTSLQRVSGVPQNNVPSRDYIEKTYATPGRYQITIKPADELNSWLWGFTTAPDAHWTNNKIVSLDSPLTAAMFATLGSRFPRAMSGWAMFAGCRGVGFHLGTNFGFSPEWVNVNNVGIGFCGRMFQNSRITAIPDGFNLPQGIRQCGTFFCMHMFSNCDLVRVPSAFRFPQLNLGQIEQEGVFAGVFQHADNRSFAREPIPASVIINGNPVPASRKHTFHMFNDTRGRERWSDWNSISANWR